MSNIIVLLNMNSDTVTIICEYLCDKDKISYLSTNTMFHMMKNIVRYENIISVLRIKKLPYYKQFTNIISNDVKSLPKSVTKLTFNKEGPQNVPDFLMFHPVINKS